MNKFTIENTKVWGLENSVRASGNPMRTEIEQEFDENAFKRLLKLANTGVGEGHDQALTGCIVQCDLYAPLYMWKQIQRYHFLDFISSQSTMHRLLKFDVSQCCVEETDPIILERYRELVEEYQRNKQELEDFKNKSGTTKTTLELIKEMLDNKWRTLVASLPCGFVLGATMTTNYRQLKTIYQQRKNHKLKEWHEFCSWIENRKEKF